MKREASVGFGRAEAKALGLAAGNTVESAAKLTAFLRGSKYGLMIVKEHPKMLEQYPSVEDTNTSVGQFLAASSPRFRSMLTSAEFKGALDSLRREVKSGILAAAQTQTMG